MVNSSVKIWWTVVWFRFNSLAIIRTASRRSDRTRARTNRTLLSVFEVEGLPERGFIFNGFTALWTVAYPGILFRGGSTNSSEDRGQREGGSGGGSPLVRGFTQFVIERNLYSD
jgi:hypothetical protein